MGTHARACTHPQVSYLLALLDLDGDREVTADEVLTVFKQASAEEGRGRGKGLYTRGPNSPQAKITRGPRWKGVQECYEKSRVGLGSLAGSGA
jgi:hypothetical protein